MNADFRHERQRTGLRQPAGGARLLSRGEALAAALPPLLVAAERVAATVSQGVHGRRYFYPLISEFPMYRSGSAFEARILPTGSGAKKRS